MRNNVFSTLIGVIILSLISCEKNNSGSYLTLLTNNSSKTWLKSITITSNTDTIELPACITDDEYVFKTDGTLQISNRGTILKVEYNSEINSIPPYCKDTLNLTSNCSWALNKTQDTLKIYYNPFTAICRIQKLTNDSLIIVYPVNDSWTQTDVYISKK